MWVFIWSNELFPGPTNLSFIVKIIRIVANVFYSNDFWTVKEFPSRKYDVIWINLFVFQTRRWWRKHASELDIFESHGSGTKNELLRKGLGFQLQFIRRFHEKGKSRIYTKLLSKQELKQTKPQKLNVITATSNVSI